MALITFLTLSKIAREPGPGPRDLRGELPMSIVDKTSGAKWTDRPTWAGLALFALAYLGCAEVGHVLAFRPEAFAAFCLESGLLLAVLVARRARTWPGFLAASLGANLASDFLFDGKPLMLGLAFWAGNAAAACVGAALLRRFADVPFRCSTPQQVLELTVFGILPGATISASVGTAALALTEAGVSTWHSWRMWWGADAVGILLVAPLLLVPRGEWAVARVGRLIRLAECAFVLVMMLTLVGFAFGRAKPPDDMIWRMPYLYTVPFLIWSGVRFGQRAGAIAALLLSLLGAWHTTRGCGPIAWLTNTDADRALMLHVCLSTVLFTVLLLSSAVAGIKDTQARLRASEAAYRSLAVLQKAILDSANHSIVSTAPDGTIVTFNAAAERWLGYRADKVVGRVTPAVFHDPAEVSARADELSGELARPVEPDFEAFVARVRLGEIDEREWTYVRRDGGRFPVRLSVTALRDDAGRITGFLGIAGDITAEKAARDDLRRAHEELDRRNAQLAELATTDALTGVKNRRRFQEDLDLLAAQASRRNSPLSLVMFDVDHFKQYNDTFGHPAGDEVLVRVGAILREVVRDQDVAARYGGEEFVVLLPGAGAAEAMVFAERLRRTLESHPWPLRPVTASLGVATATPPTPGLSDLLGRADRALYAAKRAGRNRVLRDGELGECSGFAGRPRPSSATEATPA